MTENDLEIPSWALKVRDAYRADPTRWMWVGMSSLVVVLVIGLVSYMVINQRQRASGEFSTGLLALQQGNYAGAMQSFDKIRSSYRLSGFKDRARLMSGAALFGLSRYEDAEMAYREFLAADPQSDMAPEALLGIGACLEMKGDSSAALRTYQDALTKYPEFFGRKAFEVRVARLALVAGDIAAPAAIYDRLESDSEGLWREIARGNRRMISLAAPGTAAAPGVPSAPGTAAAASETTSAFVSR